MACLCINAYASIRIYALACVACGSVAVAASTVAASTVAYSASPPSARTTSGLTVSRSSASASRTGGARSSWRSYLPQPSSTSRCEGHRHRHRLARCRESHHLPGPSISSDSNSTFFSSVLSTYSLRRVAVSYDSARFTRTKPSLSKACRAVAGSAVTSSARNGATFARGAASRARRSSTDL